MKYKVEHANGTSEVEADFFSETKDGFAFVIHGAKGPVPIAMFSGVSSITSEPSKDEKEAFDPEVVRS